jgi:hypothetical protein
MKMVKKDIERLLVFLGVVLLIPIGLVWLPLLGLLTVCEKIKERLE